MRCKLRVLVEQISAASSIVGLDSFIYACKVPPVGNTVDIKKATYTNDIGDSQLSTVWTDLEFDPKQKAVYYVMVLEIPTPRWSTYDSARNNLPLSEVVPATIQERAWSSPIWYTPEATKTAKN